MKRKGYFLLACILFSIGVLQVHADTISDLKKQQEELKQQEQELTQKANDTKAAISEANNTADELQGTINELKGAIDEVNTSIVEIMAEIDLLELDIVNKEADIAQAQTEYEEAVSTEEAQYEAMCIRVQMLYEAGNQKYLQLLLTAGSIPDMLNKADYMEQVYAYDRKMLDEYKATVERVAELEAKLETELAELETNKKLLADAQAELDLELAQLKKESSNYSLELAEVKVQAANYASQLKQQQAELKKVQSDIKENQSKLSAAQAAQSGGTQSVPKGNAVFNESEIWNSSGSDTGKRMAVYACSFIGNPYVLGGTSLTNGADCSGFTQAVYSQFGYRIPRTSYEQRSCGREVSYGEAQPGDLICYAGHVALYIGNGKIVHASTEKTGIKISYANYRTILAVRRVL